MGGAAHPSTELASPQDCFFYTHTCVDSCFATLLFLRARPASGTRWTCTVPAALAVPPWLLLLFCAARGAGASFSLSPSVLNFCYLACSGFY